jgi:hypothetical protein
MMDKVQNPINPNFYEEMSKHGNTCIVFVEASSASNAFL